MAEFLDILDENGDKTGEKKLRKEVHRDGDWHRAVHIWVINENGDVLLQRRAIDKDSNPNMLDISSAGHLSAGDESIDGATREIKEELGIDVSPEELEFVCSVKLADRYTDTFINNSFFDIYILRTTLKLSDMKFQEEEISGLFYVPYKDFKKMVAERNKELVMRDYAFDVLFDKFDKEFGDRLI